ncbi:MAG: hypothetical protein AAFO75_02075, partial [Pseudomonadota bacterium]
LLGQSRMVIASDAMIGLGRNRPTVGYVLMRKIGERVIEMDSEEAMIVMPGDTLKVELKLDNSPVGQARPGTEDPAGIYGSSLQGSSLRGGSPFTLDTSPLKPILFNEFDDEPSATVSPALLSIKTPSAAVSETARDVPKAKQPRSAPAFTASLGSSVDEREDGQQRSPVPEVLQQTVKPNGTTSEPTARVAPADLDTVPLPVRRVFVPKLPIKKDHALPVANPKRFETISNS